MEKQKIRVTKISRRSLKPLNERWGERGIDRHTDRKVISYDF
jgi:hypothetical protein